MVSRVEWLLRCTAANPWTVRKGRWLNIFVLGVSAMVLLFLIGGFLLPGSTVANARPISALLVLVLAGAYLLSRGGFVTVAARGLLISYTGAVLAALYFVQSPLPNIAFIPFLLMPMIIVAGIFLTWRAAAALLMLQMAHAAWFYSYAPLPMLVEFRSTHPGPLNWLSFTVPSFIGLFGAVAWVSSRLVQEWITDLETAVAQRTAQLAAATAAAEAASAAKSAFIAGLSHEFRIPLTVIIGFSALALEDAQAHADPDLVDQAAQIHSAGTHLLALLNTLLDLSQIDAGKITIHRETFAVQDLIQAVVTNMRALLEEQGNELRVECAPDLPEMHSDLVKVRQILFNLLSNAGKFTTGGRITCTAHAVVSDPLRTAGPDWIQLEVCDTGRGLTEDQLAQLFQDYEQGAAGISAHYGGTGLGLALSRRLARLLGGDITVTSRPGAGSTFTLLLPGLLSPPTSLPPYPTGAGHGGAQDVELRTA